MVITSGISLFKRADSGQVACGIIMTTVQGRASNSSCHKAKKNFQINCTEPQAVN